jgi:hypothetical protein
LNKGKGGNRGERLATGGKEWFGLVSVSSVGFCSKDFSSWPLSPHWVSPIGQQPVNFNFRQFKAVCHGVMSNVGSAEKPEFQDVMMAKDQDDLIRFEGKG